MEKAMNLSLTTPVAPRSESLAFLSLSTNDLDCFDQGTLSLKASQGKEHCVSPAARLPSQQDKAQIALCNLIQDLTQSHSVDEFVARRERLFSQYCDLMLGLGRIQHALTGREELNRQTKHQLVLAESMISRADEKFCPAYLKDQALFSLWELGKVVDLAAFINSRPPLPESKREEDMRLSSTCTTELLFGRLHLDCLIYAISTKRIHSEEVLELISDGMRHFVNGHVAIRLGARLRQETIDDEPVEFIPLDEEDREHLAHAFAREADEDY
jgi:hypothetical protein